MANYVENIKVGSGETWPVRDANAQEKIAALETSLTTTNGAVNNAQTSANNAQTAANEAKTAADNVAANSWMLTGGTYLGENTDLFTITTPGNYYCNVQEVVETMTNCPVAVGFTLKVYASVGFYSATDQYRFIRAEFRPYNVTNGLVWCADAETSDSGANWTWSGWYQPVATNGGIIKSDCSLYFGDMEGKHYRFVCGLDGQFHFQLWNGTAYVKTMLQFNANGNFAAGNMMPLSGGTFTGPVYAESTPRSGGNMLRGIWVGDSSWASVTTNEIQMIRK